MEASPENRESCQACGARMDVSGLAPFTMVECPQCSAQTRVKSRFGPFRLTRRHAVGGMSMVFAARDETLDREVALKILSEDYSSDERRIAAFEQEARLTASFSHPNVVRVFTTGRAFGRFFIAMEMVPGGHLEQRIHDLGKIPESEMLPLAIEVARGLKAAKSAGLIHRDVKPGNILLDAEGHAKLVDFGLALVTQGGKARAAELWATPYYVPPETVEGGEEDFRSDIYAFGATLYHTLSGKPPCGQESMSTDALREAKKHVPPLEKTDPSISAETCALVNKAMAYHAAERHTSYDQLIGDLNHALACLKQNHAPRSRRGHQRGRRWRVPAALLFAAAGLAAVWFYRHSSQRVRQEMEIAQAPLIAPPPTVTDEVDHAAGIARAFRTAREALVAADYPLAEREFAALHGNPQVQEPTRTWAGLEAILAAYLDGRSADARNAADVALKHLGTLPQDHPLAAGPWPALLRGIGALDPLAPPDMDSSAASVVAAMLAGLKNWEQGLADAAARCFRHVVEARLAEADEWARFYQSMAANYLSDFEILQGAPFTTEPEDAAACRRAVEQLDDMRASLKTTGRARFNLRARQLDLKLRSRLLAQREARRAAAAEQAAEPPAPPTLETVLERMAGYSELRDFAEAAAYLRSLPLDPPGASRESLATLAEAADAFLADLAGDLADAPFPGPLTLRDGRAAANLSATRDGALRAEMDGHVLPCEWRDLGAETLINLHRALIKQELNEDRRRRRHECAIAFEWLAGDRKRATAAAAVLAQSSPEFDQRWQALSKGLPD